MLISPKNETGPIRIRRSIVKQDRTSGYFLYILYTSQPPRMLFENTARRCTLERGYTTTDIRWILQCRIATLKNFNGAFRACLTGWWNFKSAPRGIVRVVAEFFPAMNMKCYGGFVLFNVVSAGDLEGNLRKFGEYISSRYCNLNCSSVFSV